ncbi:MAG: hypothetical protein OEZ22_08040 [Spirochaetia bacterium]|nr:hypothetical protein [Spirochaetia bacterium]
MNKLTKLSMAGLTAIVMSAGFIISCAEYEPVEGGAAQPTPAFSGLLKKAAFYPHVAATTVTGPSNPLPATGGNEPTNLRLIKSRYDSTSVGGGDDDIAKAIVRYTVTFDKRMDASTLTPENIYFLDVKDETISRNSPITKLTPLEIIYNEDTYDAYIHMEEDWQNLNGTSPDQTKNNYDVFFISKNVKSVEGYGLMGNRDCGGTGGDAFRTFCEPNDYVEILTGWTTEAVFLGNTTTAVTVSAGEDCMTPATATPAFDLFDDYDGKLNTITVTKTGANWDLTKGSVGIADKTVLTVTESDTLDGAGTEVPLTIVTIPVDTLATSISYEFTWKHDKFYRGTFNNPDGIEEQRCLYPNGEKINTVFGPIEESQDAVYDGDLDFVTDQTWIGRDQGFTTGAQLEGTDIALKYPPSPSNNGLNGNRVLLTFAHEKDPTAVPMVYNKPKIATINTNNIFAYETNANGDPEPIEIEIVTYDETNEGDTSVPTKVYVQAVDPYRTIDGMIITNGIQDEEGDPMDPNNDGTSAKFGKIDIYRTGFYNDYVYWGTTPNPEP